MKAMKTKCSGQYRGGDDINYVSYHTHTDFSLLDSITDYKEYVDKAISLGQTAISFSEHGKPLNWVSKKQYCDKMSIKYIHSVELYLTEELHPKTRDNMHIILIAKNYDGVEELNRVVSVSSDKEHFYYVNRISIDEFLSLSKNIITTSACLASPLNRLSASHPRYKELVNRFDYLEIQPHNCKEQIEYNIHLAQLSHEYNKPLIAGTDAHSLNEYMAECRNILLKAKRKYYDDDLDLTYKSYEELVSAFEKQNAIPKALWLQAIENTNIMSNSVEDFKLDTSIKYPILYGGAAKDSEIFRKLVWEKFDQKVRDNIITKEQVEVFTTAIEEELRVFEKIGMSGFVLSMSELISWCRQNNIPTGFARGSVAGSRVAYVSDIIDVNPEQWNTVFSRFCNEDRVEIGDIDIDLIETDRPKVFDYIINRFGEQHTARVASYGTNQELGTIDDIGRALKFDWNLERNYKIDDDLDENPYNFKKIDKIKKEFLTDPELTRERYKSIFYYFDGLFGKKVSQSVHPAGIIISPVALDSKYGVFDKDGYSCLFLDMDDAHSIGLAKYDFLVLGNIKIIKDTCDYAGIKYPLSHEIDWEDQNVWQDMLKSPVGIFQMESDFAFQLLKRFRPRSIEEMSLVTAGIRPSGASYRDGLISRKKHTNPSDVIDDLLKENNGYLVYQEDIIKFLKDICGFSGSEADTVRRAIGKKDEEKIREALPKILEGYCAKSDKPREIAEQEAEEFLRILEDASSYSFGYNHSISYCMIGYLCAYLRYKYPIEFITSYLNNVSNQDDIVNGTSLAETYNIQVTSPKFGVSKEEYEFNKDRMIIAKGLGSVKFFSKNVAREIYNISKKHTYNSFTDVLFALKETSIDSRQLDILVKIDFFSEFGNIPTLSRVVSMFRRYKEGDIKQLKREGLTEELESVILKYGTCIGSNGKEIKTIKITDAVGLIRELESTIISLKIPDMSFKTKISNQLDLLGTVNIATHLEEDRRKLYIEDIVPLSHNGRVWAFSVKTLSMGSGKRSRLTLKKLRFGMTPITKGDIIYCKNVFKNRKGYWELRDYRIIQ